MGCTSPVIGGDDQEQVINDASNHCSARGIDAKDSALCLNGVFANWEVNILLVLLDRLQLLLVL